MYVCVRENILIPLLTCLYIKKKKNTLVNNSVLQTKIFLGSVIVSSIGTCVGD